MVSTDLRNKQTTLSDKTGLQLCEKCGSVLVNRMLILKNGRKQKIYQCIVCKHWFPA